MLDVWIKAALEVMGLDATWIKTPHDKCIPFIKEFLEKEDLDVSLRKDVYQEIAAVSTMEDGTIDPAFFYTWLRNRIEIEKLKTFNEALNEHT